MSISVTVSGQDSISVVSSQPLTDTVEISSISALDPLKTATGLLSTATGNLDSKITTVSGLIVSNDTDLTALNTATGLLNTATGVLNTATGLLVQKSETGVLLTSGEIQTNIDTAVANLVDSAPATLNTLNELAAALGDDQNFSTTTATSLGNLSTATGVLNTNVTALQAISGSFAQTGSGNFGLLNVTGNIQGNNITTNGDLTITSIAPKIILTDTNNNSDFRIIVNDGAFKIQDTTNSNVVRFITKSDGNIGIGTTSPATKLHVNGPITGSTISGTSLFITDGVGIGTTSITAGKILDVNGDMVADKIEAQEINIKDADGYFIENKQFAKFDNNTLKFGDHDGENFETALFSNGGTEAIRITGGNVGVGTTSPQAKLHVSGDSLLSGNLTVLNNISLGGNIIDTDANKVITLATSDVTFTDKHIRAGFGVGIRGERGTTKGMDNGSTSANLGLYCNSIEAITVKNDGNVIVGTGNLGIGTTSPQAKLHVDGNTILSGVLAVTGKVGIGTDSPSQTLDILGDGFAGFRIEEGITNKSFLFQFHQTQGRLNLTTDGDAPINLRASNSDTNLLINTNGNVGIGTGTPLQKLHVNGNSIISGNLGIGTTSPDTQLHVKSTGAVALKLEADTDNSVETDNPLIQFVQDGGVISSNVGFNGVAGNSYTGAIENAFYIENTSSAAGFGAIQFVNKNEAQFTLDNNGNIGIGVTGGISSKLHVSGDTILSGNLKTSGTIEIMSDGSSSSDNSPFSFEVSADRKNTATTALYIYPTDTTNHRVFFQNPAQDRNMFAVSFAGTTQLEDVPSINGLSAKDTSTSSDNFGLGSVAGVGVRRDGGTDNFDLFVSHNSNVPDFVFHAKSGGFFSTNAQLTGGAHEIMRLTNEGNLGIGTNAPSAKLHVSGDTILSGHVGIGKDPQFPLDINGTNSTTGSTIRIGQTGGGTAIRIGAGGGSSDVVLMRVDGKDDNHDGISDSAAFGFSIKYIGSLSANANALRIISDNQQGTPVNALNILQDGSIGIKTTTPTEALHVSGNILSNGVIKAINSDANVAQLEVGRNNSELIEMKVSDSNCFITANQDSDSNGSHSFILDRVFAGSGPNNFVIRKNGSTQARIDTSGNMCIGTGTPAAKLHVDGDTILSGNLDISGSITPAKDVAFDIGSPTKRFKDLYLSGDSIFLGDTKLSISGDELQTRRGGVVRRAPLRDNLNQTRNLIVTGNAVLGKCSLSANSFVTETGDFTLGLAHRGATVLLQNPASITITCPALVPGHVTTFIAETHNPVSFATGVGMSGLNSFNGASDMAGIFAQAQIIYKSLSGAFLGGNVV